jgi:hypothetical protein
MSIRFLMRVEVDDVGAEFTAEAAPGLPVIRADRFVDRERLEAMAIEAAAQVADELERQLAAKSPTISDRS